MENKQSIIILVLVLVIVAIAVMFFSGLSTGDRETTSDTPVVPISKYMDEANGFGIDYPDDYNLQQLDSDQIRIVKVNENGKLLAMFAVSANIEPTFIPDTVIDHLPGKAISRTIDGFVAEGIRFEPSPDVITVSPGIIEYLTFKKGEKNMGIVIAGDTAELFSEVSQNLDTISFKKP